MNKTLVWALFTTITLMQMQGNMYYSFNNLHDYQGWVEVFNLLEWEELAQKRLLAAVSGAILPLVALGFIKSLIDYIKPEEDSTELTDKELDEVATKINTIQKKTKLDSTEPHIGDVISLEDLHKSTTNNTESILSEVEDPLILNEALKNIDVEYEHVVEENNQSDDDFNDLRVTLTDGIDELEESESIESTSEQGIVEQAKQPESRITKHSNVKRQREKGPLYQYRTNHKDDDKFYTTN